MHDCAPRWDPLPWIPSEANTSQFAAWQSQLRSAELYSANRSMRGLVRMKSNNWFTFAATAPNVGARFRTPPYVSSSEVVSAQPGAGVFSLRDDDAKKTEILVPTSPGTSSFKDAPCCSTTSLTIARPNPDPLPGDPSIRKNLSKTFSRAQIGIPDPESSTLRQADSPSYPERTVTAPPDGVYRRALSIRLSSSSPSNSGSPRLSHREARTRGRCRARLRGAPIPGRRREPASED